MVEDNKILDKFIKGFTTMIKKDIIYIFLIVVALSAAMLTAVNTQKEIIKCNEHWTQEFETKCNYNQIGKSPETITPFNEIPVKEVLGHIDFK